MPGHHVSRERQAERGPSNSSPKRAGVTLPVSTELDRSPAESATLSPADLSTAHVLRLQRTVGNQAVGRLLTGGGSGPRHAPYGTSTVGTTIHRSLVLNGQDKKKAEDARADLG